MTALIEIKGIENEAIKVWVHLQVLTLYEIDTTNEKFTADLYIEAKWNAKVEFNTFDDMQNVNNLITSKQWRPKWRPELKIQNIIAEDKPETWYKIENNGENGFYILEMKKVKAICYEKMELHNYPFDVQPLNVTIMSTLPITQCELTRNDDKLCDVMTDTFRDSQEWRLYRYIDIEDNRRVSSIYDDTTDHSYINFYCVVARKPFYFILNAFLLMFVITCVSFNIFSIPRTLQASRIATQTTLILTLVSFKWVINRNLPPIAYLTTLDAYSIFCICFMAVIDSWHAIIGSFYKQIDNETADTAFLISVVSVFIFCNLTFIAYILWQTGMKRRHYQKKEEYFKNELKLKNIINKTLVHLIDSNSRRRLP